jgi:tRNA-specific 2-thiouridylase
VVLGKNEDLFTREVHLTGVNLLSVDAIHTPMAVTARIRSTHRGDAATVVMTGSNTALVVFDQPQRAVCKGQSCVFYLDDVVVGGGIITD